MYMWGGRISYVMRPRDLGRGVIGVRCECGVLELNVKWCLKKGGGSWMKVGIGMLFG